jgi:NifU-like protein involved in Fe-S cluster formation
VEDSGRDDELYRKRILEHASSPHNWTPPDRPLAHVDLQYRELNPLCGDELAVTLRWERTASSSDCSASRSRHCGCAARCSR